eukprot:c20445_g1_i1 orf=2-310(-)
MLLKMAPTCTICIANPCIYSFGPHIPYYNTVGKVYTDASHNLLTTCAFALYTDASHDLLTICAFALLALLLIKTESRRPYTTGSSVRCATQVGKNLKSEGTNI